MASYKDDMIRDINALFDNIEDCGDIPLRIRAEYHHTALYNTPIEQHENPLFHQIRKHKLEILDEIIEEEEL